MIVPSLAECPQLKIVRIDGSIFFGAVNHVQKTLAELNDRFTEHHHILINCAGINFIDVAGAEMLLQTSRNLEMHGLKLSFCALKNTVRDELESNNYFEKLGAGNFYPTVDDALSEIVPRLNSSICDSCTKKVFKQCPGQC